MIESQIAIAQVCDEIKNLLLAKNEKYVDSALNPARIMSSASPVEQLLVRIDDKLNRIMQGGILEDDEDVVSDLIGYFVLLKVALKNQQQTPYNNNNSNLHNVPLTRYRSDSEEFQYNQSKHSNQAWKITEFDVGDEEHPGKG